MPSSYIEDEMNGGLLNFNLDPRTQGLLGAAAAMLQASGPSRVPISTGQALGAGLGGLLHGYGQGLQFQRFQAQMDEEKRRSEALGRLSQDPRFAGLENLLAVDPRAAIDRAYPPQRAPLVVQPGASLVNPQDPTKPLFTAPERPVKPPFEYSDLTPEQARAAKVEAAKAGATNVNVPVTVGVKEADKKFAEDFVPFVTGGYADTVKQLDQLRAAARALETEPEGTITGPVVGVMPRSALSVVNPKAASALDNVEEVVQRNLRLVLGAQFTEKEGERLIARAYNPYLSQKENAKRVNRLITQIQSAAEAKLDAARYFQQHGSLEGWRGKLWTMRDFSPESGAGNASAPKAKNFTLDDGRTVTGTLDAATGKYFVIQNGRKFWIEE